MFNEPLEEPPPRLDKLAREVIGAAIEVHRHLGPGYIESVYEEALCVELGLRAIPFSRQVRLPVTYKEHPITEFRLDLLVADDDARSAQEALGVLISAARWLGVQPLWERRK